MFRFVLLIVLVAATTAFVVPAIRTARTSNGLFMALKSNTEEPTAGPWDWIAGFFFPLSATKEMDLSKVEPNPPRFRKATTSSGTKLKKWDQQDAAAAFTAKYVPESWQKRQKYMSGLDARDNANLQDELEEYMYRGRIQKVDRNKLRVAEKFISEGASTAFSKLDKPMNAAKVVKNPSFFKGGLMSKVLKK